MTPTCTTQAISLSQCVCVCMYLCFVNRMRTHTHTHTRYADCKKGVVDGNSAGVVDNERVCRVIECVIREVTDSVAHVCVVEVFDDGTLCVYMCAPLSLEVARARTHAHTQILIG